MDHCLRHMEEAASGECRSCHGTFCARCLVYSFGPKKPPFCVGCALVASGVRNGARRTYEQPRGSAPVEVGGFASAPALFTDDTQGGGPGQPPMASGPGAGSAAQAAGVKSSWTHRRTQRQAAKAARRAAQDVAAAAAVPQPAGPMEAQNLEPVLSQHQRKALGRLSASSF